jgi:hypothetical protein
MGRFETGSLHQTLLRPENPGGWVEDNCSSSLTLTSWSVPSANSPLCRETWQPRHGPTRRLDEPGPWVESA